MFDIISLFPTNMVASAKPTHIKQSIPSLTHKLNLISSASVYTQRVGVVKCFWRKLRFIWTTHTTWQHRIYTTAPVQIPLHWQLLVIYPRGHTRWQQNPYMSQRVTLISTMLFSEMFVGCNKEIPSPTPPWLTSKRSQQRGRHCKWWFRRVAGV